MWPFASCSRPSTLLHRSGWERTACRRRRHSMLMPVPAARTQCALAIREASSMRLFSDCMRAEPLQVRNFINGEFVEPISGQYLDNVEPATGKPYSQVADSDAHDVDLAVAAAEKAFRDWSKKTGSRTVELSAANCRVDRARPGEIRARRVDRYRQADFAGAFIGYSARSREFPILRHGDFAHRIGSAHHRQRRV